MGVNLWNEIDGYRVSLDPEEGWHCNCGHFERSNICEHTRLCAVLNSFERTLPECEASPDIQYWAFKRPVYDG